MRTSTEHRALVGALSLLTSALFGCASGEPTSRERDDADPLALEQTSDVRFTQVTASGDGCPEGSWATEVAEDGKVFTTTFSAYEAAVDPKTTISNKSCQLKLKLTSSTPSSFAVTTVYYSGYAFLEEGVTGQHRVHYGFNGNSAAVGQSRTDLRGPYDDAFTFEDDIGATKQKWSPCGLEHTLNASTQLRLQNGSPRQSGYMNMSAVDGSLKLVFELTSRACPTKGGGKVDAGSAADAGSDAGSDAGTKKPK